MSYTSEIMQYVKCDRVPRKGMMVAFLHPEDNTQICIGFSLWNNMKDKFDKEFGLTIARERAIKYSRYSTAMVLDGTLSDLQKKKAERVNSMIAKGYPIPKTTTVVVPPSLTTETNLIAFIKRCSVYYKGCNLPKWAATTLERYTAVKETDHVKKDETNPEIVKSDSDPTMSASEMVRDWK